MTWCLAILHTVVGPALHAVRRSVPNRLGVAMGFGFLWPRRFATNPRAVPYPVIPLTVIGIDMIIATLPLAALLVEMIVQAFAPSVTVDPLLAKNVLWWFGHPVVYLLLFPAVAIYYYVVPRIAGRELAAGKVIALAWAIAVVANVLVWAHHVYLDYPQGSVQAGINTAMQPMTFALTIPSALSLYSLAFTIYRSDWRWTGASTALFLGLVSWLLAGLSGVVNATIALDVVVHNTLWIVGHFHQMALINIGFVVFGATYYFLPQLAGKPLYSDRLARWHVWLTFWAATANSALWIVQGLQGAPRRFAVLPGRYADLTGPGAAMGIAIAAPQLLFVWNLVQTLRGKGLTEEEAAVAAARRRRRRGRTPAEVEALIILIVLGLMAAAGFVGWVIGHETRPSRGGRPAATSAAAPTKPAPTTPSGGAAAAAGKQVFASAGCAACHTLKAAGASGTVGPNLDQKRPPASLVVQRVTNGRRLMPSFKGRLTPEQIKDVAAFVASSAGK